MSEVTVSVTLTPRAPNDFQGVGVRQRITYRVVSLTGRVKIIGGQPYTEGVEWTGKAQLLRKDGTLGVTTLALPEGFEPRPDTMQQFLEAVHERVRTE